MSLTRNKIVAIVELKEDIDDLVMAHFLALSGKVHGIVLDPEPQDALSLLRLEAIKQLGLTIYDTIPEDTEYLIVGGAFTKIASYLRNHTLKGIIANGGYAGCNIVKPEDELEKFKNKIFMRTFNFNMDAESAYKVLTSKNVAYIYLISKNVCHSMRNTQGNLHKDSFLNDYKLKDNKRLHDLLAAKEALYIIEGGQKNCSLKYKSIKPVTLDGLKGTMTQWGSVLDEASTIRISVGFKK